MAKRRSVKNSDISNWMVVVMLVAVILVSTFSIIMFLDAAEEAVPEVSVESEGVASLQIVPAPSEPSVVSAEAEAGIVVMDPVEE